MQRKLNALKWSTTLGINVMHPVRLKRHVCALQLLISLLPALFTFWNIVFLPGKNFKKFIFKTEGAIASYRCVVSRVFSKRLLLPGFEWNHRVSFEQPMPYKLIRLHMPSGRQLTPTIVRSHLKTLTYSVLNQREMYTQVCNQLACTLLNLLLNALFLDLHTITLYLWYLTYFDICTTM